MNILNLNNKLYNLKNLRKIISYLININNGYLYKQQILNKKFNLYPKCN